MEISCNDAIAGVRFRARPRAVGSRCPSNSAGLYTTLLELVSYGLGVCWYRASFHWPPPRTYTLVITPTNEGASPSR